jgi:predicted glycosyltransferase
MITWNYRVFRESASSYVIREVFYDDQGDILSCTDSAVEPSGQTIEELAKDIEYFREALGLPVLTLADIPDTPATAPRHGQSQNTSMAQILQELAAAEAHDPYTAKQTDKAA